MRISFDKYPIDIILCMLWSIILLPITLINTGKTISIVLGFPFLLFIPGYILTFALFPTIKTDKGIDVIERIILSLGLSISVVALIGVGLNYTPWGIQMVSVYLSRFIFVIGVGAIAIYRWIRAPSDKRFIICFDLSFPKSEGRLDRTLTILLAIVIILAAISLVYVVSTPKIGEKFTGFYILGSNEKAETYPKNLTVGENATIILGIINHEYKIINYTIEVWLINQSFNYDESENEKITIVDHMWFVDKMMFTLEHTDMDITPWTPQLEYDYSFSINKTGSFKLAFLMFTTPTGEYIVDEDYKDKADQKISSAYREIHLWIDVN